MHICFISSEAFPFAKTGGLADVTGTLPAALTNLGQKCALFLPHYQKIKATATNLNFDILIGKKKKLARVLKIKSQVDTYLINNDDFFNRPSLYGDEKGDYPDNLERFAFFNQATLKTIKELNLQFDILHIHDWQTALIPLYLKVLNDKSFQATRTIFTIHNLGYQGIFPKEKFDHLNLPDEYFSIDGIEYYDKINFLKGGLSFSDYLTTVSPTYAEEIQTSEFGCGLDGVLRTRRDRLAGILNGIDTEIWNPKKDKLIYYNYLKPEDKVINKSQLKKELNLADKNNPLIGIVSRLAAQKGIDIFVAGLDKIIKMGFHVVVLGTGDQTYHKLLQQQADLHPAQLSIQLKYDEKLAHRIYAGADFFLMPSQYEPCGLGQMIALTYGTIPVVRRTGGLADSVIEFDRNTGDGNGFLFEEYSTHALLETLHKAKQVYDNDGLWNKIVAGTQRYNFSWARAAQQYLELYNKVKKLPPTSI